MLVLTVAALVFYWIFKAQWLLTAATVLGLIGVFSGFLSDYIARGWMKFAELLGRFNATVLLSIVFFIFLTPVAFLFKIFRKSDTLQIKKPSGSLYETRDHAYQAKDLENTW
jgi:hypothetical protein